MKQLKNFAGFPMYFLCETKKDNKRRITFSDVEQSNIGDTLLIGVNKFVIDEITEIRKSELDYNTNKDVLFHDTICTVISLTDNKR